MDARGYFSLLVSVEACFVTNVWSVLEKIPWGAEKKVYSFVLGKKMFYIIC